MQKNHKNKIKNKCPLPALCLRESAGFKQSLYSWCLSQSLALEDSINAGRFKGDIGDNWVRKHSI